jgi:hypothetical protein
MRPDVYTKTWRRAQCSYYANGFLGRRLDAEDHAFLRQVAKAGIANGTVPQGSFLIEELDYWHLPYAIDHSVERRHGPLPVEKPPIIPDADAVMRKARRVRDKLDRAQNQKAMQEEWERQASEREERLKRTMEQDLEWDRAQNHQQQSGEARDEPLRYRYEPAPPKSSRHYVPYWKREELEAKEGTRKRAETEKEKRAVEAAKLQAKQREEKEREQREEIVREWKAKIEEKLRQDEEWVKAERARIDAEHARREHYRQYQREQRITDQRTMLAAERMERAAIRLRERKMMRDARRNFYWPLQVTDRELDDILNKVMPEPEPEEVE